MNPRSPRSSTVTIAPAVLAAAAAAMLCLLIVQVTVAGSSSGSDGPKAAASAVSAAKFKKLKKQVAALQQQVANLQPGLQGPPGPAGTGGGPPTGPAGGELAGTYPDPTIGTVAGLDLASSTAATEGINFGSDTNLYRFSNFGVSFLRTNRGFIAGESLSGGNLSVVNADVDNDTQLGDDPSEDTLTVWAGPVNFPAANGTDGKVTFGDDTNLYRSAADVLSSDDTLKAPVSQLSSHLALRRSTLGGTAPPADTAFLFVGCDGGLPVLVVRWQDGEQDFIATDDVPESPGSTC